MPARSTTVKINGAEVRVALEKRGITLTNASKIIGKEVSYMSYATKTGAIGEDAFEQLCLLLSEKPEKFLIKDEPKKLSAEQNKDLEEALNQLDEINGALFEVVQKQRQIFNEVTKTNVSMNTVLAGLKAIAEAVTKNTEATAEMLKEQKRFFEATAKFYAGKKNFDVHGRWQ